MSCENNCARKCFVGDVDEKERYPFGCPTKEEADARYAKKSDTYSKAEVDEKISHASIDAYSRAESDEKFATNVEKDDIIRRLEDLEYVEIAILSLSASPATCELGSSKEITISWNLNKAASSQEINGESVSGTSKKFTSVTSDTNYVLSVSDGKNTASKTTSVKFMNQIYYGASVNLDNVTSLSKTLSNTKTRTFTATASQNHHIIYAIPKRLGTVTFFVNGFEGGFSAPVTKSLTNASGYAEDYYVYESVQTNLGKTTVEVRE